MPRMSPLLVQVYRNRGLDTAIVSRFEDLEIRAVETIEQILAPYPKASRVFDVISRDPEVGAHWEMADYMTVVKMGFNDHGETHAKIATAYALAILSLLLKAGIKPDVLLQVNCSGEPQKYGAPVGAATHLAEQIVTMPNLSLTGLMTMAPLTRNKDVVRACFVRARELFEEIKGERLVKDEFSQLSMGMSQDYEIAVEEGATILRIVSAIFTGRETGVSL